MNRFKTLLTVLSVMLISVACEEDKAPAVEYLDVNANNISGSWELVEWDGSAVQPGTYVFINFVRNDKTFQMWQNLDSFQNVPHKVTGRYFLETDPEAGAIIRGMYDYDSGDWAHRYIIKDLTVDSMTWVAKDNHEYIQKFQKVESVPFE